MDYRLLPYGDFLQFILTGQCATPICSRFLDHQAAFEQLMAEYLHQ